MKQWILSFGMFFVSSLAGIAIAQNGVKYYEFNGSGYDLGYQHGKAMSKDIAEVVEKWKANTARVMQGDPDKMMSDFIEYANFETAIKDYAPLLWEEVRGISDGSGQSFEQILTLNLLDEFWVWINWIKQGAPHHCSTVGVPAKEGNSGFVAQNMDLEGYTQGYQVVIKINDGENSPSKMILTHPGLIVLNGMNEKGIAVCVNTIMQLKASNSGLPVAFVIRKILDSITLEQAADFVRNVEHASGQNYLIGRDGAIIDFEASAGSVVQFNPENTSGAIYHTNHPEVNTNVKPWYSHYRPGSLAENLSSENNSYIRYASLETRLSDYSAPVKEVIMATLSSRDNELNPVCRHYINENYGFTFASVVIEMSESPVMLVSCGAPDQSEFTEFTFE